MGCSDKRMKKDSGIYLEKPLKMTTKSVDYMESIYEQLIYLNEKIERFLRFVKYAAAGGFVTTAVYFLLKAGKVF